MIYDSLILFLLSSFSSYIRALAYLNINRISLFEYSHRREKMSGVIVQYIVVRGDLLTQLGWPVGALIAQACHACTAVTHLHHDDDHMKTYLSDLDNMRKVILEAESESSIRELSNKLEEGGVPHKLWIEQPENIPTCIAVKPHPKEEIQKYFKKFRLFKGI